MALLNSLAAIRQKVEERPKGFDNVRDRNLTQAMVSGEKRKIRFLQELDTEAKNYDPEYGTGYVVSEYEHPNLFWLLLVDTTEEEGECWAAEQGWKSKLNLYVNVADVTDPANPEVFYISRSALGGLGADIIESATERGSVTDAVWSIKKTGEKLKTRYALTMVDITNDPLPVPSEELIDFRESVLNEVPSDKQKEFVEEIEKRVAAKAAGEDSTTKADDDDVW